MKLLAKKKFDYIFFLFLKIHCVYLVKIWNANNESYQKIIAFLCVELLLKVTRHMKRFSLKNHKTSRAEDIWCCICSRFKFPNRKVCKTRIISSKGHRRPLNICHGIWLVRDVYTKLAWEKAPSIRTCMWEMFHFAECAKSLIAKADHFAHFLCSWNIRQKLFCLFSWAFLKPKLSVVILLAIFIVGAHLHHSLFLSEKLAHMLMAYALEWN